MPLVLRLVLCEGTLIPYFLIKDSLPGSWMLEEALEMDIWIFTEELNYILPLISVHFLKHFTAHS